MAGVDRSPPGTDTSRRRLTCAVGRGLEQSQRGWDRPAEAGLVVAGRAPRRFENNFCTARTFRHPGLLWSSRVGWIHTHACHCVRAFSLRGSVPLSCPDRSEIRTSGPWSLRKCLCAGYGLSLRQGAEGHWCDPGVASAQGLRGAGVGTGFTGGSEALNRRPSPRSPPSRKRVMNPAKKNLRDSSARIAGCSGHANDPPDLLLRACPADPHGCAAGSLRSQCRAGLRLALGSPGRSFPRSGSRSARSMIDPVVVHLTGTLSPNALMDCQSSVNCLAYTVEGA